MATRLEPEVWSLDNCAACGMCVAACSKQMLTWEGGDHPVLKKRTKTVGYTKTELDSCTFCQHLCEEACPRLEHWLPYEAKLTLAATARGPMKSGSPGDVIRAILTTARSAGLIDGVVMLDIDPWDLKPMARVASSVEDIVRAVGPQYLWAPVFDALNEAVFVQHMENIAVVGTPWSAQAIRKVKMSQNPRMKPYQTSIRLAISMFCTGMYKPEMITTLLTKRLNIAPEQVKRLEVSPDRETLRVILWDGSQHTIAREQAESYTKSGCGSCDDYLGESADIAVGTLGAPENYSTLIARTRTGEIFIRNATQMNLLETTHQVDESLLAAATAEKDRRTRAQAFKDLQILMLDGLADPLKRNDAIQLFVKLYRTPARSGDKASIRSGCTGC
jgi:coenzyme F420-reducing hydrogenase beta subunit